MSITILFITEIHICAIHAFTLIKDLPPPLLRRGHWNYYGNSRQLNQQQQQRYQSERVDDLDISLMTTNVTDTLIVPEFIMDEDIKIDETCVTTTTTTVVAPHDVILADVSVGTGGQAWQRLVGGGGGDNGGISSLSSKPTVWTEFSRIAQECTQQRNQSIVNLGQGFPDWLPPPFAIESLVEAALEGTTGIGSSSSARNGNNVGVGSIHQYTRPAGHPNLVQQLARRYSLHMNRPIDAMKEVAVTVGASQALYLTLQVLIQPGDEVILFEPFFDLYLNQIRLAGGTPVFVPLKFQPYDKMAC